MLAGTRPGCRVAGRGDTPAPRARRSYTTVMASARLRAGAVAALIGATLLLAACTPEPGGSPTPEPTVATPSGSPTPSPSATPGGDATPSASPSAEPEALEIPGCDDLIPLPVVQAHFPNAVPIESGADPADVMAGPAATTAVRAAVQAEICTWGIPASDGGFNVIVAELTESARDGLVAELRGAGTFTEGAVGGGVSFSREIDTELGITTVTYVFDDRVWVTVNGTLHLDSSRQLAAAALEGVRAANGE